MPIIEHLAAGQARPRAVVATQYHELAALGLVRPQVHLLRASVEEAPDVIRFPHRIEPGAADRSCGIEVARLAGLPAAVLDRAREVADTHDRSAPRSPAASAADPGVTGLRYS